MKDNILNYLAYNKETGVLTWKIDRARNAKAGSVAGCKSKNGISIRFNKLDYKASRLVWELHHGESPMFAISHKNGDNTDNRIENLTPKPFKKRGGYEPCVNRNSV